MHASLRQWIWPELELYDLRLVLCSAFVMKHGSRGPGGPQSFAFPAGLRIVDSSIHTLRKESVRIRNAEDSELPAVRIQREQRIGIVPGCDRCVFAQAERIELIDPVVVVGIRASGIRHTFELRSRRLIKLPAFLALLSRGAGTIQRSLALAPVEAGEMSAGEDRPHDAVTIHVEPAW